MNIYVGNLSSEVTDEDLKAAFEVYGKVATVKIIKDMFSGVTKGFGFVEMPSKNEGQEAINKLAGHNLKGKAIIVNEARPQREQRRGGGGSRGGGGGPRGGGGRRY